ncbi:hypothetical protein PSACC_02680 [Paramicrosporidium saccamoebae]|uniref:Uncharacterized protein n=1 Tax=Paramicrosporidium saccamoebae TaxID=1246581 RepID=A0A2H9TIC1_9FUNG|nr:hypothetical protein PSACC_02680 [Paramicrosporidium saccamoebae]
MSSEDGPRVNHLRLALHKMLHATLKNCSTPVEAVHAAVARPKLAAMERLQSSVEHLEWQTSQRRAELSARRSALSKRCEHVRDTQTLYGVAFGEVLAAPTGEMERLVDRMVHQVPKSNESC